jgi:hypothetical protein
VARQCLKTWWDLWLGVAARAAVCRRILIPFAWRDWFDFGGALGDGLPHPIRLWSLDLSAYDQRLVRGAEPKPETFPKTETITYEFKGTKYTAGQTVRVVWYDGGLLPRADLAPLPEGEKLPDNGCLLIGDNGVLLCRHGGSPQLLPQEKFVVPRATAQPVDHYLQWTNAIRGEGKTTSNLTMAR